MIFFMCPMGHRLAVPDELVGQRGRCPVCRQRVYVPELDSQPARHRKLADPGPYMIELDPEPPPAAPVPVPDLVPGAAPPWAAPGAIAPPPPPHLAAASDPQMPSDAPIAHAAQLAAGWPYAAGLPGGAGGSTGAAPPIPPAMSPSQFASAPAALPIAQAPIAQAPVPYVPVAMLDNEPSPDNRPQMPVQTAWFLAVAMALVVVFCAAPALKHFNLLQAPGWARVVLLVALVQLAYIAWMVVLPDWSTVWLGMLVFAATAALYALGMAIALATPRNKPMILGLAEVRQTAAGWCAAAIVLTSLLTYLCGRISSHWRRIYEQSKARQV